MACYLGAGSGHVWLAIFISWIGRRQKDAGLGSAPSALYRCRATARFDRPDGAMAGCHGRYAGLAPFNRRNSHLGGGIQNQKHICRNLAWGHLSLYHRANGIGFVTCEHGGSDCHYTSRV